jgi:hypothetical protein
MDKKRTHTIYAGDSADVDWNKGKWIFLDVGFSNHRRSCGLLVGDGKPCDLLFSEAQHEIKKVISGSQSLVNLVIEAPLSVCFDSIGNPKRRKIEYEGGKTRAWYCGPGCSVMVAAMYLIREIHECRPRIPVRLFEGFVTFKDTVKRSRHKEDVTSLRSFVQNPQTSPGSIYTDHNLREDPSDKLLSATALLGFDVGIPPVIKPISKGPPSRHR